MIDIHCHILPGMDDGAGDYRQALEMARVAADSGVAAIVATPHFRGDPEALDQIPRLISRYRRLAQELRREQIPVKLFPGAEILCVDGTLELAEARKLPTLSNTNYLLVEFFFDESLDYMDDQLAGLAECGYRAVIAHPERYRAVQQTPDALSDWFRQGYVIQLNKGSILGHFGPSPEDTAHWALARGLAHTVASDGHDTRQRSPDMDRLRDVLAELYSEAYAQLLLHGNPLRLLQNLPMAPSVSL